MGAPSEPQSPVPGASARTRLTVAVLARDEQDVLPATLESARAIADEVLLVDTGSADRSRVVAYRYGARVVQMPWGDDFAAARNFGLDQAAGAWVLWLDAGEHVAPDAAGALRGFVDHRADASKAYLVTVELAPAGTQGSSEQIAQARLVPKRPGLRFEGRVRETLRPALEALGMTLAPAPGRILCHPRRHDPRWKAARAARNLRIADLENAGNRRPPVRLLLAMGDALSDLGERQAARTVYLRAVQDAPAGSTEQLDAYYGLLTTYEGDADAAGEQLAAGIRALEAFPLDAQLLCAMGGYLQARNQLPLASRAFETALRHGQVDPETWRLADIADVAAVCLSVTLELQQKDGEAITALEEAVAEGGSPRVRRHLIDLCVKQGRLDQALGQTPSLGLAPGELAAMDDAVRGACKAAQNDRLAAIGYLQSAYVAGCREPLCLRWLAATLLAAGQIDAAEPVLRDWQAVEPDSAELRAYLEGIRQITTESAAQPEAGPRRVRIDPATPGAAVLQPALTTPPVGQVSNLP